MTIKDMNNYINQLWDWGFLDDCFGETKIKVTDIDGFVERKGKFLVIECKSHNAPVPTGQKIMFEQMVKTGLFTILVVWGERNQPETAVVYGRRGVKEYNPFSEDEFIRLVSRWFDYASKGQR